MILGLLYPQSWFHDAQADFEDFESEA